MIFLPTFQLTEKNVIVKKSKKFNLLKFTFSDRATIVCLSVSLEIDFPFYFYQILYLYTHAHLLIYVHIYLLRVYMYKFLLHLLF